MQVGKMKVAYEGTVRVAHGKLFKLNLSVDDPKHRYNYLTILHWGDRRQGDRPWRVLVGWKPSPHHHKTVGDYETVEQAVNAALAFARMESYERGTREYVEAYRDRWLPGVRIVDELPEGWHVKTGALTAPCGAEWVSKGSLFYRTTGGEKYEHALMYTGR